MRNFIFVLLFLPAFSWGQNSTVFQVWNEVGLSYKLDKKQSLAFDLTTRHDALGIQTYFPQISYRYKVSKFFKPSIDYRYIGTRTNEGNYTYQHRLNANLQFTHELNRLLLGLRMRYQYSSNRLAANFEPEFGQALRIKPSLAYDLKKSNLEPQISAEFFSGPMDGQNGYQLNRIRWSIGLGYAINSAHALEINYLYDQRISSPGTLNRAILNFSYGYNLDPEGSKKKQTARRNSKFL